MKLSTSSRFKVALAASGLLLIANGLPAHGANIAQRTLNAGKQVSITYPALFKLPKTGCARLPIKYQIRQMSIEDSSFYVVIEDDANKPIGQVTWLGMSVEESREPMPEKGVLNMKICRKAWVDSDENQVYGAKKGTYEVLLSAVSDETIDSSSSIKLSE